MVRMSDLVRGIVREPAVAPAPRPAPAETAEPPAERADRPPRTPPGAGESTAAPLAASARDRDVTTDAEAPARPAAVPETLPSVPAAAAEDAQALFDELHDFMVEIREAVHANASLPWPKLESLVDRVAGALRHSADLFWIANNPGGRPRGDYLTLH